MPPSDPGLRRATRSWFFSGWAWIAAAALLPPAVAYFVHPAAGVALGLLLAALAWRAVWEPQSTLAAQLRAYLGGRYEAREGLKRAGVTGELGRSVDAIGQRLLLHREQARSEHQQATTRLRGDLAQASARGVELREELRQALGAATLKSELLSSMSHELRTPLTAILGFADLLQKTPLNADQAEAVALLNKSAHGLLTMINDLLDWSRIEAGKLALHEVSFNLSDCLEDTIALLAPLAFEKDLELVHFLYHDVPLALRGDPLRVQQILTNLLSNGIKFTEHGEVVVRVMKERDSGDRVWLRIAVSDTGIGISRGQQERLFQAFEGSASRTGQQPSTGLGLSIARKLTELMEGTIAVESQPGKGTTFSAVIGLKLAQDRAQSAPAWDGLRGLKVWLFEPNRTARLALLHSLEYWGSAVRAFETAGEIGESLKHASADKLPDMVVLGLKPRDLEDPSVAAVLARCADRHPALLVLLASVDHESQAQMLAQGAARCLPKSASRLALYRELNELALGLGAAGSRKVLDGHRVLLADNNRANRRYLAALIKGLGAELLEADNGEEAVALWQQHRPRFVLLDVHMPKLDGLEASREIRLREGSDRRTAIVGASASLDPERRQAVFLAGMDDFLVKPFDERQLLRALAPWLGQARGPSSEPAAASARERLTQDPELQSLLAEELPQQLRELEHAYAAGDAEATRNAAHQLHGTAAFYRLSNLRQALSALEQHLLEHPRVEDQARVRDDLASARVAVAEVIRQLRPARTG